MEPVSPLYVLKYVCQDSFKRTLQREICLERKELSLVQRVLCSRRVLQVFFWSYCVWVYVCVYMHVPARSHSFTWWSDNNGSWFVYLVGPGDQTQIIRLGSKCLYPPRAILPSRCWVFDMTLLMKIVITTAVLPALLKNDAIFLRRLFKWLIQCRIQVELLLLSYIRLGLFRLQDEFGVCFVPLPQEGLPGFRGVKSAGESPKGQSLRESQGLPAADTAATSLHLSRSSLQVLATLNKKLTGHMEKKKDLPPELWACCFAVLATYSLWRSLGGDGAWGSSRGIAHHHWATGLAQFQWDAFLNPARKTKAQRMPPYIKIGEKLLQ